MEKDARPQSRLWIVVVRKEEVQEKLLNGDFYKSDLPWKGKAI